MHINIHKETEGLVLPKLAGGKALVYLCRDNEDISRVSQLLKSFSYDGDVLEFPEWDCLPYDRISPSSSICYRRLKTLSVLLKSKSNRIILTTMMGLIQKVLPQSAIKGSALDLSVKQEIRQVEILKFLVSHGFNRSVNAMDSGEFAARGSIVDVVPSEAKVGYRLDFFGNTLESIRTFDTETQKSISHVKKVSLLPSSEIVLGEVETKTFKEKYQARFGVAQDIMYENVLAGKKAIGMEHWLPLFYEECGVLSDYLPKDAAVYLPFDYELLLEEAWKTISSQFELRTNPKLNRNDGVLNVLKPEEFYNSALGDINVQKYSPFANENSEFLNVDIIHQTSKTEEITVFDKLKQIKSKNTIVISCFTQASRERLSNILEDHEVNFYNIDHWGDKLEKGKIGLFIAPIEHGFRTKEFTIYSEQDVLGKRLSRKAEPKKKKSKKSLKAALTNLYPGDLVVHKEHGIGRFEKLEQLTVGNAAHDFVKLLYADNAKYYLPVENLELVTAYGSDTAVLDKLGSLGWQSRKAKLKARIKIAAEKLLKVAAERDLVKMPHINFNEEMYHKFCESFPYVETPDQLSAIEDIVSDYEGEKPMDRLVCGDVGFGKTEVALRAICKILASSNPSQAVLLVPTTLLARQHFKTLQERFADFPFKIAQLSKFTDRKQVKKIKEDLAAGKIDIVVGTHMLLAKDVKFKNLGLLMIDEEQHFGVGQKENLKELKANCHVLTLSATPIPRTLQMSLFGIKDLSLIATPPVDRMPIKTYVMPYDGVTLREAILREHFRGGRTFYITPRVAYLDGIMESLKELVPEIKAVKAHGQMTAAKLDQVMNDFYDGKYDVLVSTNIIESGLDVPQANTMIIDRADLYGLAQLYQIRGRVGRSNIQAYSYLTFPPNKRLSDAAEKRLSVISSFETLGVGFSIATHDMDIRGYGNLVGEEQSGQVKEVGVELYQSMLQEAIADLKDNQDAVEDRDWSPNLNLGVSVQIPESYIPDNSLRLSLYRQVANLDDIGELDEFATDMIDRFGSIPEETKHLFKIVQLKHYAKQANIEKIDLGGKGLLISFRENTPKSPEKILDLVSKNPVLFKFRADQKIFINYTDSNPDKIILKLEEILSKLA